MLRPLPNESSPDAIDLRPVVLDEPSVGHGSTLCRVGMFVAATKRQEE